MPRHDRFRIRTLVVEAGAEHPAIDFGAADEWRVLVTVAGTPCAYVIMPSPGATLGGELAAATIGAHARERIAEQRLEARLRRRLGTAPPPPPLRCSVVICTHRRPGFLPGALESLARLDPAPDEVVVVDNDPGELDCRAEAEGAGALYVREDRRGLSWARRAGLRAAAGAVVAFTDDDCVVSPSWLRNARALFADPTVGAVTGPGFAYELETPGQLKRDENAGLIDRLRPLSFDWTNQLPLQAGAVGMGANMMFRRSVGGDELFPPELGAGTATQGAEDLYAIYRVLAAGHRVAYDPGAYLLHRHPRDVRSVYETMHAWGVGFTAFLAKALVEDRELSGILLWSWHWKMLGRALLNLASGTGTPIEVALRWSCFRAGLGGPAAWRRALREAGERDARAGPNGTAPAPGPSAGASGAAAAAAADGPPDLSVVVVGADPALLERCLRALARQDAPGVRWEVAVAAPPHVVAPAAAAALRDLVEVRTVEVPAGGAAAATAGAEAAAGRLLLFLDEDLEPAPGLVAAHVRRQADAPADRVVIGYTAPRPDGGGLAAYADRLRSEDRARLAREAVTPTFVHVPAANVSLGREAFERVGAFDPQLGPRAGWEWGVRALKAGLQATHEPAARAWRDVVDDTRSYLAQADLEGAADAVLLGRHPSTGPSLPVAAASAGRPRGAAGPLVCRPAARAVVVTVLDALEAMRFRRTWARLARLAWRGAYLHAFHAAGGRDPHPARAATVRIELASEEPIAAPTVAAPYVELTLHGRSLRTLSPPGGNWHPALARAAVASLPRDELLALAGVDEAAAAPSLAGTAVVVGGPPGPSAPGRPAFEAAGARVATVPVGTPAAEFWSRVDAAVRHSAEEVVGVPLPGVTAEPGWLAEARIALAGERVAAVIGPGLRPGERPSPVTLMSRELRHAPYSPGGRPPQYIAFRRSLYEAVGGIDPAVAALGRHAPLLDFLERALDAGLVVAYRETPGLAPPAAHRPARSPWEWSRWRARGALIVRRSSAVGGVRGAAWLATRGLLPLARNAWTMLRVGEPSLRYWTGSATAFAWGAATAAVHLSRAGVSGPSPRTPRARPWPPAWDGRDGRTAPSC